MTISTSLFGTPNDRLAAEIARHQSELQAIRNDAMNERAELDRVIQAIDEQQLSLSFVPLGPTTSTLHLTDLCE